MSFRNQKGFTLVELAIVMIIVGLLIGGVLKGQELIKNAQVTAVVAQIKGYTASTLTFLDTYGGLPGDMANALTRVPGCTGNDAAGNFCYNGDGNSIIGSTALDLRLTNQAGTTALPNVETSMYWKHMALAGLITGIDPTANPATPAWGETHPASKMAGGYHIFYSRDAGTINTRMGPGHKLRWQNAINQNLDGAQSGIFPVSPVMAEQIDRKIDDGRYIYGNVTADFESSGCGVGTGANAVYGTTNQKNCIMYFGID